MSKSKSKSKSESERINGNFIKRVGIALVALLLIILCFKGCESENDREPVYAQMTYDQEIPVFIVYNISEDIDHRYQCELYNEETREWYEETLEIDYLFLEDETIVEKTNLVEGSILYDINYIYPMFEIDMPWTTDYMSDIQRETRGKWLCLDVRMIIPISYTVYTNGTQIYNNDFDCYIFEKLESEHEVYDLPGKINRECFDKVRWQP